MKIDQAKDQIRWCAEQMNHRFKGVVFDEWAVVAILEGKLRVLEYSGPRPQEFRRNFLRDAGGLRAGLIAGKHPPGYFEFAHTGAGTGFESFMTVGNDTYLIWNNTAKSMDNIAEDPWWLAAQVPFVELVDRFCSDPVGLLTEH
ncbi:MAG: hypothetical protein ACREIC_28150, partial [Limisphaerales bacterium]